MNVTTRYHVRWMLSRDMPEVLAIETAIFPQPWTPDDFTRCLRLRSCIGMVVEFFDRIAGFMIYELHERRLHVLNFAVHPAYRRMGVGRRMIEKLVEKCSRHRTRLTAHVREGNLPAQLFFKACGFEAVKVLRGHYEDTSEDGYRMVKRIPADVTEAI